jgi:hypothetical protein
MADLLKDKRMEIVEKAIAKGKKRQGYKPNRETDKYILNRMLENVPGWRPETNPGREIASERHQGGEGKEYVARQQLEEEDSDWFKPKTREQLLEGWKKYEEDINTLSDYEKKPVPKSYNQREREAYHRMKNSLGEMSGFSRAIAIGGSKGYGLTPKERQQLESLQGPLAEDMTAPGAQEDRPGRLQEILEALDFGNPESGGRAFLRELKRRAIDDRLPRTQMGWKKTPGEELLKAKLEELGLKDIPRNRARAMQELGWTHVPKEAMARDQHGNPVPLYVDEMKADREAAAEKAYMQGRRDPMLDTPERD